MKLQGELQTKFNIYDKESDNEDAGVAEANDEDHPFLKCDTCFRHEIHNCTSDYELNLSSILSSDISVSDQYSNLKATCSCDPIQYNACIQCKINLTSDNYNAISSIDTIVLIYFLQTLLGLTTIFHISMEEIKE